MLIFDDLPEYGRIISYPPSEALAAMVEEDKRLVCEAATYVMDGEDQDANDQLSQHSR